MEQIGVRELRQNASKYLARVASGETIEVTDRGHAVALLIPPGTDRWAALIESGRISAPLDDEDVVAEAPADYGIGASAELSAMREDER
jgi:prevent-host-death family protein